MTDEKATAKDAAESKPLKISQPSAPDDEKKSTTPKGAGKIGGQDAEIPEPGNKVDWPDVHDPYAKVGAEARRVGVHEAVERDGAVPLPVGHPQNEIGAIPRSPGEWPTGGHTPENPLGRSVPGKDRPASEDAHTSATKREQARLVNEEAEKKGVSPLSPKIDHEKAETEAAKNVASAKK